MFLFSIFFKTPGKKCKPNAHREMAQCGTAESTLHLSLSFVLMEGIITAVRCSHPCKPPFWQWVSYTRHVGKKAGSAQKSLALPCKEQCTWVAQNFWPIFPAMTFSSSLLSIFFPSRTYFSSTLKLPSTGPHHYPAFPLPPAPHFVPASSSPFSLKTSFLNSLFCWQNGHS